MRPTGPIIALACALGMFAAQSPAWAKGVGVRTAQPQPLLDLDSLAMFETAAGAPLEAEPGAVQPSGPRKVYPPELVRRIQEGLAEQGFYLGPVDGRFGPQTEAAIRAYQTSADLPVDGLPSEHLLLDLETGGQVGRLLNNLEQSRTAAVRTAREALMSRPETRALVEGVESEAPPAPHDLDACLAEPEPRCLLEEASLSARDIEKPEMRDWALGEILAAQAKAGLADDAMATTRRIHDPRLIMVALGDIAKAQAESGNARDALGAVEIIPDTAQQVEAYVAIAGIQAQQGRAEDVASTAQRLDDLMARISEPMGKISLRTRLAVIVHKAGHTDLATQYLQAAEALLDTVQGRHDRDQALRHIASAYAGTGNPARAVEIMKQVQNGSDDVPVLIAAATGLAQAGEAGQALIAAESIEAMRYRALVLARIASFQAGAGNLERARESLDKALEAAKTIRFPFAKAYAFSRIALALNDVGISAGNDADLLSEALDTAALIKDERLRAHILWTISDERRRAADAEGAQRAQAEAERATVEIKSPFSRVWMLCDIAEERARRGELDAAWALFHDALGEARTITHPWGRARALGKVAGTMTTLAIHTSERALH